jgi:chromosomal replication initiator protein
MNYDLLWSKVLEIISTKVNSLVYSTWFQTAKFYKIEGNEVTIIAPSDIHRNRLINVYLPDIIAAIKEVTNQTYEINIILEDELVNNSKLSTESVEKPSEEKEKIEYHHTSNLNKNYTFDNYVVGNSNKLAHATAVAVAESPGQTYNPLFIYGASGLGKTHLMHAIGNYIEQNSNKKVLYVTSDQFIDDFSKISRKDNNQSNFDYADYFKNKYRTLDVLIIDDIQFLATTQKTQEEFFHTFNVLYNDNKQIIISSDRSPNDLKSLEDRLKTRFCWGLTVDIYPPELELRKNILKKKIQASNLLPEIDEEVIDYIASKMASDVRKLEGAINRLMAESLTMGYEKITLPIAVEALKSMINKGVTETTNIIRVQNAVANFHNISVDDIKSKKKSALIVGARQIAMYLSREILNEPFERIGLEFGGRDHSTVMYAYDKIKSEINDNPELKNTIERIKENIL